MRSAYSDIYRIGNDLIAAYFDITSEKSSKKCWRCKKTSKTDALEKITICEIVNSSTYENIALESKLGKRITRMASRDYYQGCCLACAENIDTKEFLHLLAA